MRHAEQARRPQPLKADKRHTEQARRPQPLKADKRHTEQARRPNLLKAGDHQTAKPHTSLTSTTIMQRSEQMERVGTCFVSVLETEHHPSRL